MSIETPATATREWFTVDTGDAVREFGSDANSGLSAAEAASRLAQHGPNLIASEPAPSAWQIALRQLADPMNIMLVAVAVVSWFINQASVGVMVGVLVILNVVLGTNQELKAQA